MKKNKMISVLGLLLGLAAFAVPSNATIVVSTASVAGVLLAAAPPSGQKTVVKGCHLANDTSVALCVNLLDGATKKMALCAGAQGQADTPHESPLPSGGPANGAIDEFYGESLLLAGAFNVTTSTPSASIVLTCAYSFSTY